MLTLPQLEIRPVLSNDIESISQLEECCFNDPYPPYFLSQLAEANPDTFLVAISEGKILGYAVVDHWADHDHLISIAVHPERRRRGIAQQLISSLGLRLLSGRPIRLEVRKNNQAAIGFYVKNGFTEVGVQEGYYRDGEDALIMERKA